MPFALTSVSAIRSMSQHALASHWDRLAAGRCFPPFTEFMLEPGMHDPMQLVVWNVESEGRDVKFRALYQGENVAEVFNSAWAGKTMDEVVPMSLRRLAIDAARECIASSCLTYTIISTIDSKERQVDCERLLLPFGRGSKVEQILASLQLAKVPGGVRRNKILGNFQIHAELLFAGRIKPGFTNAKPICDPARDAPVIPSAAPSTPSEALSPSKAVEAPVKLVGEAVIEKRRSVRRNMKKAARICFAKESRTCAIRNMSATGALIEGANLAEAPDAFGLVLEMESVQRPCTVVWRDKAQIGVRFS